LRLFSSIAHVPNYDFSTVNVDGTGHGGVNIDIGEARSLLWYTNRHYEPSFDWRCSTEVKTTLCSLATHVPNIVCHRKRMGENDHQDVAKHTDMSRQLMLRIMDRHYEPSMAPGGAILDQQERFCAHFLVSHTQNTWILFYM
jgi:hypothetical protein